MKLKLFMVTLIALFISNAFSSCEKEVTSTSTTTYAEVSSIISANCAIVGCHDATTNQSNVNCTSFATLSGATGGHKDILSTATNDFSHRVLVVKTMPPAGALSQVSQDLLQLWVDNNFAEN
jgi:hypothetical protein